MLKSAIEINKLTAEMKERQLKEEMTLISNKIAKSVNQGLYSCSVPSLSTEAKSKLIDLGYTINQRICGLNETEYVIGWY